MPRRKTTGTRSQGNKKAAAANIGYKAGLRKMADTLRGSMEDAEYEARRQYLKAQTRLAQSARPSTTS